MAGRSTAVLACVLGLLLAGAAAARGGAAADSSYPWQITATTVSEAAAQSQRFTGNENDNIIFKWFNQWASQYDRVYFSMDEMRTAISKFRQALRDVRALNTRPDATSIAEINQFADLGFQKFSDSWLMQIDPTRQFRRRAQEHQQINTAAQDGLSRGGRRLQATLVDWRTTGKVTPIKNQGSCGSCWAFAATAAIESAYLMHQQTNYTATPVNLSEQQMVSCATQAAGYYSQGCNGGCSDMAINYVYNVNQTTEKRYPYSSTTGVCNTSIVSGDVPLPSSGLILGGAVKYVTPNYQSTLISAINMQPIVVYFQVTNDFYNYKSGIYQPNSGCTQNVNHVMLAVGYYNNGNNTESYWIVKNSWGTSWGEQGYVRIQFTGDGVGPCLLQNYPLYPVISFKYLSNLP